VSILPDSGQNNHSPSAPGGVAAPGPVLEPHSGQTARETAVRGVRLAPLRNEHDERPDPHRGPGEETGLSGARGPAAPDRENGEKRERDRDPRRLPAAQEVGGKKKGRQCRSQQQDEAHFPTGANRVRASGGALR
jgi:hypothetical protein